MSTSRKSSDVNKHVVPQFDRGSADPFRLLVQSNEALNRSLQLLVFGLLEILSLQLTENDPIKSRRLFQHEMKLLQESKVLPPAMSLQADSIRKTKWFQKYVRALHETFQKALRYAEEPSVDASDKTNSFDNECKEVALRKSLIPELRIEIPDPILQLRVVPSFNLKENWKSNDFNNLCIFRYVHDFEEKGRVGKGAFGSVFSAKSRLDDCIYAIKKIVFRENNDQTRRQAKHALREVRILASLSHQNIVQYHCAWLEVVPNTSNRTHRTSSSSSYPSSAGISGKSALPTAQTKPMDSLDDMIQFKENSDPQPIIEENESPQKSPTTTSTSPDDDDEDKSEISTSEFNQQNSMIGQYHSDGGASRSQEKSLSVVSKSSFYSNGSDEKHLNKQLIPFHPHRGNFRPVSYSQLNEGHIVLFIQMQLCTTTLHDWLRCRDRNFAENHDDQFDLTRSLNDTDQRICWRIFKQLLTAVEYLHSQSFVHRDIKPRNIFLITDPNDKTLIHLKLGDFGLATLFDSNAPSNALSKFEVDEATSGVGTALYAPPEQLNANPCLITEKSDCFSLGIVLYELFSIFYTEQERILSLGNLRVQRIAEKSFVDKYPFEALLIEEFVRHEPDERPSVKTIFTTYMNEIQKKSRKSTLITKQMIIEQLEESLRDKDRRIQQLEIELNRKIS